MGGDEKLSLGIFLERKLDDGIHEAQDQVVKFVQEKERGLQKVHRPHSKSAESQRKP